MKSSIVILVLIFSLGFFINESFAEIPENRTFLLEGSGFAVTEEIIKTSDINIILSSQQQHGSTIDFLTESGFITLNNEIFTISNLEGKFLRGGNYIRINGNVENSNGLENTISFFGRIIEESKNGIVYGFTGRITNENDNYKIIYTTKLSTILTTTSAESKDDSLTTIIIENAHSKNSGKKLSTSIFSTNPGKSITVINNDIVSHKFISVISNTSSSSRMNYDDVLLCELGEIVPPISAGPNYSSGKSDNNACDFNKDERINTSEILPGESITINITDIGNYRIIDPNYPWIEFVVYSFPNMNN